MPKLIKHGRINLTRPVKFTLVLENIGYTDPAKWNVHVEGLNELVAVYTSNSPLLFKDYASLTSPLSNELVARLETRTIQLARQNGLETPTFRTRLSNIRFARDPNLPDVTLCTVKIWLF